MENQTSEMSKTTKRSCGMSCRKMLMLASIAIVTLTCGCSSTDKTDKNTDTTEATAERNNDVIASQPESNIEQPSASVDKEEPAVAPLTQYALVEVLDRNIGVGFRTTAGEVLKTLGFTVKKFKRPSNVDEMEPFVFMTAHRQESNGSTNIVLMNGEDQLLTIDFANHDDVDKFVESMQKSGYTYSDGIYAHPKNATGKIYIKVKGLKVKIISPFEMLPSEW